MDQPAVTRRDFVVAGLAGAGVLAGGPVPAWARSHRGRLRLRAPGSRPRPWEPIGTPGEPFEINTVVVLMLENHSFDNILGLLPYRVASRSGVDGLPGHGHAPTASNPDLNGNAVRSFHLPDLCPNHGLTQNWNSSHNQYNGGRNDGFVRVAGTPTPMGYFDDRDLPVTYALASHFPISERYFCSLLGQTDPNRRFMFCATADGETNDVPAGITMHVPSGTIFDTLDAARISWHVYYDNVPSPLLVENFRDNAHQVARCVKNPQFFTDAAAGRLPRVSFVEPNFNVQSEENPQDVAFGESFLWRVASALMHGPRWRSTALFVTYDEHGGYYDHVPPPRAIPPDHTPPRIGQPGEGTFRAGYDRYGFRVPLTLISPWARPRYVSRFTADHTSILSFIEHRWNLPALTRRDANAWHLRDMFDMRHPHFGHPPPIPTPPSINSTLARCRADGRNPPTLSSQAPQADWSRQLERLL
jgi:phospholipase C